MSVGDGADYSGHMNAAGFAVALDELRSIGCVVDESGGEIAVSFPGGADVAPGLVERALVIMQRYSRSPGQPSTDSPSTAVTRTKDQA